MRAVRPGVSSWIPGLRWSRPELSAVCHCFPLCADRMFGGDTPPGFELQLKLLPIRVSTHESILTTAVTTVRPTSFPDSILLSPLTGWNTCAAPPSLVFRIQVLGRNSQTPKRAKPAWSYTACSTFPLKQSPLHPRTCLPFPSSPPLPSSPPAPARDLMWSPWAPGWPGHVLCSAHQAGYSHLNPRTCSIYQSSVPTKCRAPCQAPGPKSVFNLYSHFSRSARCFPFYRRGNRGSFL